MTRTAQQRNAKKAKVADLEEVCDVAWGHWQNYLDSDGDDADELAELLAAVLPHLPPATAAADNDGGGSSGRGGDAPLLSNVRTRADLLPHLASVAAAALADDSIAQFLAPPDNNEKEREATAGDASETTAKKNGERDDGKERRTSHRNKECWEEIRQHLRVALDPAVVGNNNPAARSTAANLARATGCRDPGTVLDWYLRAAEDAHDLRQQALRILESDAVDDDTKAWIEGVVLHQMVGVELEGDDASGSGDDEPDGEDAAGSWSPSAVEATARFMAATLLSTAGRHDEALRQLQHMDVTHRLHPNVWSGKASSNESTAPTPVEESDAQIRLFGADGGGLLPPELYRRLCEEFRPNAPYWRESGYARRGYYSFFADHRSGSAPRNAVEHAIVHHLLPCVQSLPFPPGSPPIVGFEWWVHTRPTGASLGHNLHFDTDEALLNTGCGQVEHPAYSAVLYLTGDDDAGATVVLNQTPDAVDNAAYCHRNVPRPNTLLVFPGNLLHGVLPCPGRHRRDHDPSRETAAELFDDLEPPPADDDDSNGGSPHHRLTLLVGFWTRRVPDHVATRSYGPCGPLPDDGTSWVRQLERGYPTKSPPPVSPQPALPGRPVPAIAPAWEVVKGSGRLPIPRGALDHRFFAKAAPLCFRCSLFERDEDDATGSGEHDNGGEGDDGNDDDSST